ncbi:MAG: RNA-dependent DNA polymerase, partial [Roseofilum sp. SID2]
YVDDFALFSNDFQFLREAREEIEQYLVQLRLKIHPIKSQIFLTRHGANFLGFRMFPDCIRVRNENLRRARRRWRTLQNDYAQGKITIDQIQQSWQSWCAHLEYGDTWRLRQQIFASLVFSRE